MSTSIPTLSQTKANFNSTADENLTEKHLRLYCCERMLHIKKANFQDRKRTRISFSLRNLACTFQEISFPFY